MKKSRQSALRRLAVTTLVTLASAGTAVTAQAAYIATATEVGGDVVFEGSGSLDTSAWTLITSGNYSFGYIIPNSGFALGVRECSGCVDLYGDPIGFNGPAAIGPGTSRTSTPVVSGDIAGVRFDSAGPFMYLPIGYESANTLTGSVTRFQSQTFATMGLTPGQYEWAWGTGASADSYKLNVGAVRIPAAVWLFGSGLLGLVGVARRKARA